jgi:hypothetical protein
MVRLTSLNSVDQWEAEQAAGYPEITIFIENLKNLIREKPELGQPGPLLSIKGITLPCRKHSVKISLFSNRYAIGYDFLTAHYLSNETDAGIVKMNFS